MSGAVATAGSSVRGLLRDALTLDRTQSDPVVAFRNAVGIAAPLAIGALAGSASFGLAATIGALQVGFADRPGPYLLRTMRMLGVAVLAALTSALAVVASRSDLASAAVLLALALVAGLLVTAGPSATQAGIAATATALVLGHTPQPASVALHVGLLVLAGGVGQTVLAVAAWPLGRHRPERVALAALYRDLAESTRTQHGTGAGPPAGDSLTTARQTLYGLGHDHGPSVEAYRVLLDEADRIRREIVVLVSAAERLGPRSPIATGLVRGALTAAGGVLDEIAGALQQGRPLDEPVLDRARTAITAAIARLDADPDGPDPLTRRATAARLRVLGGHLRAAVESTRVGADEGRTGETGPGGRALRSAAAVLRANLTPDSVIVRHAARLAVVVAGSDLVVRLLGIDRGYWVALTILVVMRPDFGATLQRSVLRTVGTMIGLLLASGLVHWIPGGQWYEVALIAVFAFGMRLAGPGNVGLTAISLSGLVVVLLSIEGIAPSDTIGERALATLAGGAIAIAAALVLLPAWERAYVPVRLADLLSRYRDLLDALVEPDPDRATDLARLQEVRIACRRARTAAQATVDRAAAEPVRGTDVVELGRAVLSHSHRTVHAMLAIEAVRRVLREAGALPHLHAFRDATDETLDELAAALRERRAPGQLPDLRLAREDLAPGLTAVLDARAETTGGLDTATVVLDACDRIADSLETLAGELRRQVRALSGPRAASVASGG